MKSLKSYIAGFAAVLALGATLSACQDSFDDPSVPEPVAKLTPNTTLLDLKTEFWDDATNYCVEIPERADGSHYIIHGRVISSDFQGNVFKSLVIQDETCALAMSINSFNLYLEHRVGQEIVIDATGMYIGKYNGLQQLGLPEWYAQGNAFETTFMPPEFFKLHAENNGFPQPEKIDTIVVNSFAEIGSNPAELRKWQSQLVRFNNVEFEEGGKALFSEYQSSGVDRVLVDAAGSTMKVRTSGYSKFWNKTLPAGRGDVVAICSFYGTAGYQLTLIDYAGCMNFGNPTLAPGTEEKPWTVDEVIANEAAQDVKSGWVTGFMVGTVAPDVVTVASNDDIEWGADPVLGNTLVIGPTADCKDFAKCLVVGLPVGSALEKYGAIRENPANVGKQIWLKGTFEPYMGTYGITGTQGTVNEFRIDGLDIDTEQGTESNPYTCDQIKALNPTSTDEAVKSGVWVSGYIVGYYQDYAAHFEVGKQASNILMSDVPRPTDATQCICIQLLANTEPRAKLNLVDNPGNFGKQAMVYGDVMKYNTLPGIKNTTNYKIDGQGGGTTPQPGDALFSETFKSSMGEFTIHDVKMPSAATYIWSHDESYGYMKASAYISGTSYASDSWLVSPVFDLAGATNPSLTFDHVVNKFPAASDVQKLLSLCVSVDGGDWQPLTVPSWSTNTNWTFVNSGSISLAAYAGHKIILGFHYTSLDGTSGTWEVKNFAINGSGSLTTSPVTTFPGGGGSTGGGDEPNPPTPPTPPTATTKGDFNSFNGGKSVSKYGTYTNATGWTASNCSILGGAESADVKANPNFGFIGAVGTLAPCLTGNTNNPGKVVSPTLTGGCGTIKFNYGFAYKDTKCTFTINVMQGGTAVVTKKVELTAVEQFKAYSYELPVNITGDFTIEIVNNCASATAKNTDRIAIWNFDWTN